MKKSKKIKSFVFYLILSLIIILTSIIFSLLTTLNVIQLCFNEIRTSYFLELLCANINKIGKKDELIWLKPEDILRVYSNDILELNEKTKAEKLIDGDINTSAYPENKEFDYILEFIDGYEINKVELVWGGSGTSDKHIQEWSLEAKSGLLGGWSVIAGEKKTPFTEKTIVDTNFKASSVRVHAKSQDNWIGILEVKILRKS